MKVTAYPHKLKGRRNTTLVLGAFEAIHNGHLSLFAAAKNFKHPLVVMLIKNPEHLPKHPGAVYATLSTRLQQLANVGVDYALVVDFTPEIMQTPGAQFLAHLMQLASAKDVVAGEEFAMGAHRDWVARTEARATPFVHTAPMIRFNSAKLGTTTLRELVQVGDVEIIAKLAPFPYTVETTVQPQGGFTFTTVLPQRGVYAVAVVVNAVRYWGVARIGIDAHELRVPQLQAQPPYAASVEFRKLIRVIVAERQDTITLDDEKQALLFLAKVL